MLSIRVVVLVVIFMVFAGGMPFIVKAQSTNMAASTTAQTQKAQRRSVRKANREKKNAELNKLEKNGYNPAGDQFNYPQNLQDAEKKATGPRAASTPKSSAEAVCG